jgi:hypothetical protein
MAEELGGFSAIDPSSPRTRMAVYSLSAFSAAGSGSPPSMSAGNGRPSPSGSLESYVFADEGGHRAAIIYCVALSAERSRRVLSRESALYRTHDQLRQAAQQRRGQLRTRVRPAARRRDHGSLRTQLYEQLCAT